jgi:hypothetical protein
MCGSEERTGSVYIHIYICMHVYIHIYMHTHGREGGRGEPWFLAAFARLFFTHCPLWKMGRKKRKE